MNTLADYRFVYFTMENVQVWKVEEPPRNVMQLREGVTDEPPFDGLSKANQGSLPSLKAWAAGPSGFLTFVLGEERHCND